MPASLVPMHVSTQLTTEAPCPAQTTETTEVYRKLRFTLRYLLTGHDTTVPA